MVVGYSIPSISIQDPFIPHRENIGSIRSPFNTSFYQLDIPDPAADKPVA